MIRGIHYLSAEVKPKLMSSQGAALTMNELYGLVHCEVCIAQCQKRHIAL